MADRGSGTHEGNSERVADGPRIAETDLRTLLASFDEGFCTLEVLLGEAGEPVDYRLLETNAAFEAATGLRGAVGKTVRELAPDLGSDALATLGRVAKTGRPERFEHVTPVSGRHLAVKALPVGPAGSHTLALICSDVTRSRQTELALLRSEQRFEILSETNSLLLSTDDPEAVIQGVAERVMRHLGADVFFNYVLDPGAERLRLNACGGVAQRVAESIGRLELGQAICGCVARDGERIISQDVQNNGDPRAQLVRGMGVESYVCHPLKAGEHTIGTLSFGTKRQTYFTADQIEFMRTVANQVSVALKNARLFEEERAARAEADQHAQQLATLSAFESVAISSLDPQEIASRFAHLAREQLGVDMANVILADTAAGLLRIIGQAGAPNGPQPTAVPVDGDTQAAATFRGGETVAIGDIAAGHAASATTKEGAKRLGAGAVVQVPMRVRGEVVGLTSFIYVEPQCFTAASISFLESVTAQIAVGIQNARLYEAERERARFGQSMVRINEELASSLDIGTSLPDVLESASDALCAMGAFIVDRVEEGWRIRETAGAVRVSPGDLFLDGDAPNAMAILATRRPILVEDVAGDARINPAMTQRLGYRSYASYPLIVRDAVVGLVAVHFSEPHPFTEPERDYLRRVAFAISLSEENSRLYKAEHDIADRLQSALLDLPADVRGLEFAHAYHSATEAARVGGDFYDLFELTYDHVGVLIGDVAGKGLDAAVLTSMVKNTIRAHANERGKSPSEILTLTNEVIYKSTPTEAFVTVFFGILDCRDGRFVYSNAGHTTSAVLRGDGRVGKLSVTGPILGAFEGVDFDEAETNLELADLLFLYTDGVTEARRGADLYGEERLFARLGAANGAAPSDVVGKMIADVISFSGNRLRDDTAVLAVKRVEQDPGEPHQRKLKM